MGWCRDATKIDQKRRATLTEVRRVAGPCESSLQNPSSEQCRPASRTAARLMALGVGLAEIRQTSTLLAAAGEPEDSGGYERHRGQDGDQRAPGVGKRPPSGKSCHHVGAVAQ
jgi:hypothetical protein